ncbi:hemopexin repeat-containing protein [Prevotella pallens]
MFLFSNNKFWSYNNNLPNWHKKSTSDVEMLSFLLWVVMDSNHRS